ncbi:MAG: hypothetical protein KKA19_06765 [Candidatus Margulisbacteria bacterium]|nr:hypothetical protein [Candidatus Margulisiibacteriota bacterium]
MTEKLNTILEAGLLMLITPLIILNLFGGIISGIWLIILGEWRIVLTGIAYTLLLNFFILPVALMPQFLLVIPVKFLMKRKILLIFYTFLVSLYSIGILAISCLWILNKFAHMANNDTFIPILILSYGVAIGPWFYFAKEEGDSTQIITFFGAISYIVAIIMLLFGVPFLTIIITFCAIMFFSHLLKFIILRREFSSAA